MSQRINVPIALLNLGVESAEVVDFLNCLPEFWNAFEFQELANISEYFYKAHPLTVALLEKTGLL